MRLTWDDAVQVTITGLRRLKHRTLLNRERVEIAMHLADVENSVRWSVADLLVDTEDAVARGAKGDHYASVASKLPYKVESRTLENWASVARRIPYGQRHADLSFSHHIVLASVDADQREEFAQAAIAQRLSVRGLRELIRKTRGVQDNSAPASNIGFGYDADMSHVAVVEAEQLRNTVDKLEQENYLLRLGVAATEESAKNHWELVNLATDIRIYVNVPNGENAEKYAKKRLEEVLSGIGANKNI